MFYAYIFRDPSRNMEPFYVGKGTGPRWKRHFISKRKSPLVQRLMFMKRNDVQPDVEVIDALCEEHAKFLEICLIQVLGRKDLNKGTLLNLTDGGDGRTTWSEVQKKEHSAKITGQKRTQETRKQMSMSAKNASAKRLAHPNAGMKGKKQSEETRRKISEAMKLKRLQVTK